VSPGRARTGTCRGSLPQLRQFAAADKILLQKLVTDQFLACDGLPRIGVNPAIFRRGGLDRPLRRVGRIAENRPWRSAPRGFQPK